MKFFMIIGRNALYTYEKNGQKFEQQFIEGSEIYPYSISSISEDVDSYLDALANEKNLGTKAKLEFDILESANLLANTGVLNVLEEYVENKYSLDDAIPTVLKKLSRDKKLLINEYGINYDGCSYKAGNGQLIRGEFDLLAYTVHYNDMIDLINI